MAWNILGFLGPADDHIRLGKTLELGVASRFYQRFFLRRFAEFALYSGADFKSLSAEPL